jgi:hypothetical protein
MVRTWQIIMFSGVALTCASSTAPVGPSGYSVSLRRIVADANTQNEGHPFSAWPLRGRKSRCLRPPQRAPSSANATRAPAHECLLPDSSPDP